MISLALRGMGERKLRSALTAVAVLLGVAMVAGTFVQTDRITNAFEQIEQAARGGTDVVVTSKQAFTGTFAPDNPVDEALLGDVRAVPGVAKAQGHLLETGSLVVDGEAVSSNFAPAIVESALDEPFDPLRYTEGGPPRRTGEVAINAQMAEDEGLDVGERVGLTTRTGVKPVTISGVAEYGDAQSLGGATLVVVGLPDMQRWFARRGELTEIVVAAADGVSPDTLARRVDAAVPRDMKVQTGQQSAQETSDEINDTIGGFLTPVLLALSGAALLVGGFIIFNTFSITVAQRTREFGLLRAMGATRRQVLGAVVVEALVIGTLSSLLGIAGGLGFAAVLGALFDAVGFGIPTAGLELAPRTVILSVAVGIGVTLVAAVVPARRATRVPPIAALSEVPASDAPGGRHRAASWLAAGVGALGALLLAQGLFGSGPATTRLAGLAGGALLVFIAVALMSRHLVRPLASAIGWPLERVFEEPGRLARDNAMRNPARTATTAAALMVGLGLVVFVAVVAAGFKASIDDRLDTLVKADIIVTAKGFQPLSVGASEAIARVPGVRATSPQYGDQIQVNGRPVSTAIDVLDGVDPAVLAQVYETEWLRNGSDNLLLRLHGTNAVVEEQFAKRHDLSVGERFRVETPAGNSATLRTIGVYRDPQILQGLMVDVATFRRLSSLRDPFAFFVATDPGAPAPEVKARVELALDGYPTAEVRTNADYRKLIEDQVNQIVYLLYALLAMSLVISLFGIANSLFLSIHERVREFGLLRAIGATQGQVRRVVRFESVITSIIGGVLGIVVGVVFAALAVAALSGLGLVFSVPAGQLAVFLVLAVLVGIAGAVLPARRAAAVDVLEAMRHD